MHVFIVFIRPFTRVEADASSPTGHDQVWCCPSSTIGAIGVVDVEMLESFWLSRVLGTKPSAALLMRYPRASCFECAHRMMSRNSDSSMPAACRTRWSATHKLNSARCSNNGSQMLTSTSTSALSSVLFSKTSNAYFQVDLARPESPALLLMGGFTMLLVASHWE